MQSAEDFMRDFFRARTTEIKGELERRSPFRNKFFSDSCLWDSRKGTIERSQNETIEGVSKSDVEVLVITREIKPYPRLRYHLKVVGEGWQIEAVDTECLRCNGNVGNTTCISCFGDGWVYQKDYLDRIERLKFQLQKHGSSNPRLRRKRF
jgi:hypothetical protein